MAELGWYGLTIPEEYGGSGGTFLDASIFLEEYTRGQAPIGGYNVSLITAGALMRFGSDEQKEEHLSHFAGGGTLAIAMSEPESGSDVGSLRARARRDNGDWVLDGTKTWISYAHRASHTLIVVRSGEPRGENKHEGLSMFMVPRDAAGLTISPIETLGGNEVNEMALDGVRVPESALVGEEGNGWRQLMAGLNVERIILGASALGLAQRAFDDALAYVKERKQFGRPVGTFQSQQHRFADLATDLLQARLLVRHAATLVDEDPKALAQEASMTKLACTELAKRATLEGMQAMGGYGYAVEYPMERYLRSAVVQTIFGGTSEIQKNIIARTLGL
jgi:alkylation response protein AidB-like acyl-CoA dehydrogenase